MKTVLPVPCLASLFLFVPSMSPAIDAPLGIEAVTGIRSEYIHRGFRLSGTTLEFQLEAEIALDRDSYFNLGSWYLAGGSDDFRETGVFLDYTRELSEQWTLGTSLTYRDFQNSALRSGVEVGLLLDYRLSDDWELGTALYYDFETKGLYGESSLNWSRPLSEKAFVSSTTGVSYVSDYFERNGLNDAFTRWSLTYGISDSVSISPYLGASFSLDSSDADSEFYSGAYFEVLF